MKEEEAKFQSYKKRLERYKENGHRHFNKGELKGALNIPEEYHERLAEELDFVKEAFEDMKEEIQEERTRDLSGFIFNENEVYQRKVFTSHQIGENLFAFGLLLPKWEDRKDKKGNILGKKQVWAPIIITSKNRGVPVSLAFQEKYKISYDGIPEQMKLRWELKDVEDFIKNDQETFLTGKSIFEKVVKEYEYYLYFREKNWYYVNALWDMGTYLHQLFSNFPIKEERGLKGTAKSKTMEVSSKITLNATDLMTNPSEATLFRLTEDLRPTKYIDEAEKLFKWTPTGQETDNRVELLNSSYSRNGSVPRVEKQGNKFITKNYAVYSPTRVGSINGLYGATEDRSITQVHTKALDNDERGERNPEDDKDHIKWVKIRNSLYRWALTNWLYVYSAYRSFNVKTRLKKRDMQIWKPLIVIAKVIDEENLMPKIISFAEQMSQIKKNDSLSEDSLDYKYLKIIYEIMKRVDYNGKVHLEDIKGIYDERHGGTAVKNNKAISNRIDNLGFKELKDRDSKGTYYLLTREIFEAVTSPLTNDFTTLSTLSTSLRVNDNKNSVDTMKNDVEENVESVESVEYVDNKKKKNWINLTPKSEKVFSKEEIEQTGLSVEEFNKLKQELVNNG